MGDEVEDILVGIGHAGLVQQCWLEQSRRVRGSARERVGWEGRVVLILCTVCPGCREARYMQADGDESGNIM
jgi:hypothetical protein